MAYPQASSLRIPSVAPDHVRSSAAYAEVLLRKTELSAELEELTSEYTNEHPKVRETKFSLEAMQREITRLSQVKPGESGRLTTALGKLILKKGEAEMDHWKLAALYKDEHPDVKRAKKKLEVYENAIREILGR